MKPDQIILVCAQGWFQLAEGRCRELQPWADVKGSALVVVEFAQSQVGVQSCKGKAEYAAAIIEKAVRAEGAVDGPLQVFVHRQIRHNDSSSVLYTAIPLELWQQFQTWSRRQPDHCLIVPLAGLFLGKAADDQLQVLRIGSQLHAFSAAGSKMHYAGATAIGSDPADLHAPLRTVVMQLKAGGWTGAPKGVRWGGVLADDLDVERGLLGKLAEAGLNDVRLMPHGSFRIGDAASASALPHLLDAMDTQAIQAPWLGRMAWLSESYVVPLAALIAVMTVGLGAFAFFSNHLIAQEQTALQALQSETEQLRQRVGQVDRANAAALDPEAATFVRQLGFAAVHDPIRMLATVRQAARPGVRVQRVQLVKTDSQARPRFRVDGVVDGQANQELRRFLAELLAQGWQAESVSPNDGSPGAFAYLLKPAAPGKSV